MAKDLTDHLRTVHFSLIVACVVVLLAVIGDSPGQVARAHDQLKNVAQIKTEWRQWLSTLAADQAETLQQQGFWKPLAIPTIVTSCVGTKTWRLTLKGSPLRVRLQTQNRWQDLADSQDSDGPLDNNALLNFRRPDDGVANPWPKTLDDFKEFWNTADRVYLRVTDNVGDEMLLVDVDGRADPVGAPRRHPRSPDCAGSPHDNEPVDLEFREGGTKPCTEAIDRLAQSRVYCGQVRSEPLVVAVPVRFRDVRMGLSLRAWLKKHYGLSVPAESFQKDFPDLAAVTAHYSSLLIESVVNVLGAEVSRTSERLQVVGLTLSVVTISQIGVLLIVLIQVYLLLHLKQLASAMHQPDTAWIGLYTQHLARWATVVTVVVLPAVTVVVAGSMAPWWLGVPCGVSSIVLAASSLPHLPQRPVIFSRVQWIRWARFTRR